MKERQTGPQLAQAQCIQLSQHPVFKRRALQQATRLALPQGRESLWSFPTRSYLAALRQRHAEGWSRLESQAERINQLSIELEAAVIELKAIASDTQDWGAMQTSTAPQTICEYHSASVPSVQQTPSGSFILTSRSMDLGKAEREAALLAQSLRQRTRRRRIEQN